MQCANCPSEAVYVYAPRNISPTQYCDRHLPSFLRSAARAGVLETTDAFSRLRKEALDKLSPAEQPQELVEPDEAADPEPESQDVPAETKPKRKRAPRKKAAAPEDQAAE